MAYLPDLTAPSSWEREVERRRSRTFSVFIALFFALLLCAASAFATAVYLDGVKVDARVALDSDPKPDPQAAAVVEDPQKALQDAFVAGRKAGYKKGVAAGKLQSEPARKKAYQRGLTAGRSQGQEAGEKMGYSKGYQDASAKYQAAWDQANPVSSPTDTAAGADTAPTP
jgi:hypothetical protein